MSTAACHQGFVSSSQRFAPAAAPAAAPDYSSWDGEPGSLRGDAGRLGPGAYVKLVGGWVFAAMMLVASDDCCGTWHHHRTTLAHLDPELLNPRPLG